eukprot:3474121-Pyramimonas_sp.AAC.1
MTGTRAAGVFVRRSILVDHRGLSDGARGGVVHRLPRGRNVEPVASRGAGPSDGADRARPGGAPP